ncbi:glycosyltransferase family 39 protein [Palaeococcus ferrophilus]|uniref:glycosyltransferase family 39 protein n=1 Tax=Palaeococcus ferrophilus TaxID=83868 RepID=UPI0009FD9A8B|nr:glycosyltransferase family 39 protein [Palaeococcus ferrophilus]
MDVEKLFRPKFAVPGITLITLIYRLIPLRFKYLLGFDPYFHLAYIEEALKAGEWFNFLTIAGGPWGYQVKLVHPLGLWMTPAYVYKLLSIFGLSLQTAFRITPVIFGTLTVLAFYFALLRLYDEKRAFFASLFLAISYGHVFRSMANYYRGDNYMLFWYSVAFLGIALALTYKKGPKRFAFYLIPALASGFASIFWQAYYPIFIFLLSNALLIGAGAFILGEKEGFKDAMLIVLSTVPGVLLANALGGKFGYGMLGYNDWTGKRIAEELGLSFGILKDAYLIVHLRYLVPLSLAFIVFLFLLVRILKDKRHRAGFVIVLAFIGILLLFRGAGPLKELSAGFGIFKNWPVQETGPPTKGDLWASYNLALFLLPLYALSFRRGNVRDFPLLGLMLPSLYMLAFWKRFLFIASPAIAFPAGIGLVELYEAIRPRLSGRKFLAIGLVLLVLIPSTSGALALSKVWNTKPIITEEWVEALTWLKENSNENDIVLAWWDYGHWITYYSRRSPVAQGSSNPSVAAYLLGLLGENWAQNLGVDYVIVSYEDFLKLGPIINTVKLSKRWENITDEEYGFALLPLTGVYGNIFTFENGPYKALVAKRNTIWEAKVVAGGATGYPSELLVEVGNETINAPLSSRASLGPVLYVNLNYGYAFLMSRTIANTTMARLFTGDAPNHYRLVYSDGGRIKIYRFEHPNVIVTRTNGTVVFHFKNTTGTGLGIWGFLDNGTLVFKKWYGVKGLEEFELPGDVNGTVIRYAYAEGKQIVDRGVFRCNGRKQNVSKSSVLQIFVSKNLLNARR